MKALQVIESAYRCNIEEQDDPVIWISHAMQKAGADIAILLRGNAVNYAIKHQDASGLTFGNMNHAFPPDMETEISRFIKNGVAVFLINEDAIERGIETNDMVSGIEFIQRANMPSIFDSYDQVWHW